MNAHMTLAFIFATSMEAEPFISIVDAELTAEDPWPIYQTRISGQPTIIIVTGMGIEPAKNATEFIIENYAANTIFNCGVAGSLTDDFVVGDIVNITQSRIYQAGEIGEDVCHLSAHSSTLKGYTDGVLLTVEQAVFDQDQKRILSDVAQLVDMEGSIIARLCEQNNIPCQLIKIISDQSTERNQLKINLGNVSERLAHRVAVDIIHLFSQEMTA